MIPAKCVSASILEEEGWNFPNLENKIKQKFYTIIDTALQQRKALGHSENRQQYLEHLRSPVEVQSGLQPWVIMFYFYSLSTIMPTWAGHALGHPWKYI